MTGIAIPGLGEKLRLLAQLADLGGWTGLSQRLERKPGTIRYWGNGSDTRQPGMLPSNRLTVLRNTIAEAINEDPTSQRIDDLINAPPSELRDVLLGRSDIALRDVIDVLGQPANARLLKDRSTKIELVRVERKSVKTVELNVALDVPFRLVISDAQRRAVTIILQKSPSAWGYLGSGSRDAEGNLHVPGRIGSEFATMAEGTEIGVHRFVVIGLSTEPPINLSRYLRNEIALDLSAVSAIAATLQKSDKRKCTILYCDIMIERLKA
jgi:hypothetical protein